jgi:hypothetical protein
MVNVEQALRESGMRSETIKALSDQQRHNAFVGAMFNTIRAGRPVAEIMGQTVVALCKHSDAAERHAQLLTERTVVPLTVLPERRSAKF